jgi:hypothetical protein
MGRRRSRCQLPEESNHWQQGFADRYERVLFDQTAESTIMTEKSNSGILVLFFVLAFLLVFTGEFLGCYYQWAAIKITGSGDWCEPFLNMITDL